MQWDTVIARGSVFSDTSIYDPSAWGDETTDAEASTLGSAVCAKFEELANAEYPGANIYLNTDTSEVIGDADYDYSDGDDFEDIMSRATEYVFDNISDILEAQE